MVVNIVIYLMCSIIKIYFLGKIQLDLFIVVALVVVDVLVVVVVVVVVVVLKTIFPRTNESPRQS